jgi:hypothetical protein
MVFVSMISSGLCNKSFKRFVKANIKNLNKSSAFSRNIRSRTVQLFKFVTKLLCHLWGEGIKAEKSRFFLLRKVRRCNSVLLFNPIS